MGDKGYIVTNLLPLLCIVFSCNISIVCIFFVSLHKIIESEYLHTSAAVGFDSLAGQASLINTFKVKS